MNNLIESTTEIKRKERRGDLEEGIDLVCFSGGVYLFVV